MSVVLATRLPSLFQQISNAARQLFGLKIQPSKLGQFTKSGAFEPTGYAGISTGVGKVASGRVVTAGAKVGVGAGLAGVGLAGLGFGIEKAASSLNPFDDKDNGFNIGTFLIVGIIILVLILLLRRK